MHLCIDIAHLYLWIIIAQDRDCFSYPTDMDTSIYSSIYVDGIVSDL